MPTYEFVCHSSHVSELFLRTIPEELPSHMACEVCRGPAFRKEFGFVNHTMGRTNTTESLDAYQEAAAEMEHTYKNTDDPQVKAANPPEVWHAAKVRAEARELAGARTFDKDKPQWRAKEIE